MSYSEEAVRAVVADYDEGRRQLLARRDARLRGFHAEGWRPVDLQRITGYSRETIRHALHPEVRAATNASRRKTAPSGGSRPAADQRGYGDRKPYVIPDDLAELRGPTAGTVTLPHHLDWSGRAAYDLDRPARLASMYKVVLNEAASVEDLRTWLDRAALVEAWPTLWLPPRLREQWETRFPELAGRQPAVA